MYTALSVLAPFTLVAVAAALSACSEVPATKAGACESLAAFADAPNVTVDKAEIVPAGFVPPGEKRAIPQPFCRVQATARPSSDSDIKFEMWLPDASDWNGRFLANGGGGNSGAIIYSRLTEGLARGYASLSTNNGHASKGGNIHEQSWAIGHPEKVIDFGYRAQTVTALAGKQITRAFYGSPASKSYWIGCSQGGGKGLMQAQRYPENFDGIVAGAPVFDWTGAMFSPAWVSCSSAASLRIVSVSNMIWDVLEPFQRHRFC
jgi:feruloyl esterase